MGPKERSWLTTWSSFFKNLAAILVKQVIGWLANYQNKVSETVADRIATALPNVSSGKVIEVFRELDRLGLGELRLGRHGQKTRILWNSHPGEIGRKFRELTMLENYPQDEIAEELKSLHAKENTCEFRNGMTDRKKWVFDGERELAHGALSPDFNFRLLVKGKFGISEIDVMIKRLEFEIKRLEFEKEILEGKYVREEDRRPRTSEDPRPQHLSTRLRAGSGDELSLRLTGNPSKNEAYDLPVHLYCNNLCQPSPGYERFP